jgi:hypothetical protein
VGKHVRRFLSLPPGAKPRYRFVIALGTIVLIAFAAMVTVAALYPENGPANAEPTGPVNPFGDAPLPGLTDPSVPDPGQTTATAAPSGPLTAVYAVPSTWVWGSGFQAQVAMTNTTPTPQAWQVRLSYPSSVTAFIGSWVDGGAQPGSETSGQQFTFTGAQPVQPGQTVVLKVQFDKVPVSDFGVQQCVVNGRPCTAS